jgi:hypothetical protein
MVAFRSAKSDHVNNLCMCRSKNVPNIKQIEPNIQSPKFFFNDEQKRHRQKTTDQRLSHNEKPPSTNAESLTPSPFMSTSRDEFDNSGQDITNTNHLEK